MKTKLLLITTFTVICAVMGTLFMGNFNSQVDENVQCSPKAIEMMNSFDLGADYHFVIQRLGELNLPYSIWKEGVEMVPSKNLQNPVGPFEILVTVNDKKTFGFFVGKRNHIVLKLDASNKIVRRTCSLVLTGP